jgi:hypothetical protein
MTFAKGVGGRGAISIAESLSNRRARGAHIRRFSNPGKYLAPIKRGSNH